MMVTLADYGPEVRAGIKQVHEVVSNLHQQLIKWDLVVWIAGNVPRCLHTTDLFAIKPSGLCYECLTPSSMIVCDFGDDMVDGTEAPFSNTASHAYIYRNMPDVYGIVHAHSTYAAAWATTGQNIPYGLTMMGDEFDDPIPVGLFRLINSETVGKSVVKTLRKYPKSSVVLMQSHGLFTISKDAEDAVKAAAMTEEVAHAMWTTRQLGGIVEIDQADIGELDSHYQNIYSQHRFDGVSAALRKVRRTFARLHLPRLADAHIKSVLASPARWCLGSPL